MGQSLKKSKSIDLPNTYQGIIASIIEHTIKYANTGIKPALTPELFDLLDVLSVNELSMLYDYFVRHLAKYHVSLDSSMFDITIKKAIKRNSLDVNKIEFSHEPATKELRLALSRCYALEIILEFMKVKVLI